MVDGIVAFRYGGVVTVSGKGGRPRKWRSDADRVRAYRARQRGEDEPRTFEAALDDGDDLARAVEHARQLQAELAAAADYAGELGAALSAERRTSASLRRKLDQTNAEAFALRATDARRAEEQLQLHRRIDELQAEVAELHINLRHARQAIGHPGPNRAARREAAKREGGSR